MGIDNVINCILLFGFIGIGGGIGIYELVGCCFYVGVIVKF